MKDIFALIERRKNQIAGHPLYTWLRSKEVPLEDRFVFAPLFVTYIMSFCDLNKWFLRYPAPRDELERAINEHTREDETHSRLFLEDWHKLGFDEQLGWGSCRTIEWYYAAPETELFRAYGMEIMEMCVRHPEPAIRFAFMEAIEACGHVFFAATSQVAGELTARSSMDYRYFGIYHFERETGHLMSDTVCFDRVVLDPARRRVAERLVHRIFDMFVVENDRLLSYARRALRGERGARVAELGQPVAPDAGTQDPPEAQPRRDHGRMAPAQARLEARLQARKRKTADHPLFRWMRSETDTPALDKLRRLVPLWTPDVMGYKDLNRYALSYYNPADRYQRAINRWTSDLQSHYRLFLRDWTALGMDDFLGWGASDTITFYCLSRHTEVQRRNMATFVKLAYAHPEPALRFWLIEALEATGHAFFAATRELAARVEQDTGARLDYLADRHQVAHDALAPDPAADAVFFKGEDIDERTQDIARVMIDTVFDCIDEQYTLSLDLVSREQCFQMAS